MLWPGEGAGYPPVALPPIRSPRRSGVRGLRVPQIAERGVSLNQSEYFGAGVAARGELSDFVADRGKLPWLKPRQERRREFKECVLLPCRGQLPERCTDRRDEFIPLHAPIVESHAPATMQN
jgi:hypothetical protein